MQGAGHASLKCDSKGEAARGLVREFESYIEESEVIGVGTGSTAARALKALFDRGLLKGKVLVASSMSSALLIAELGGKPVMPHVIDGIDFYFDGADEVDPINLYLLKGRGAALLGEKILAHMAKYRVYVVDDSKIVEKLGSRRPVPVEAVSWALRHVVRTVESMGYRVAPRSSGGKDGPVISDWGGVIIDVDTGPISDPVGVERRLKSIPGVIETGIFIGLADAVVVGKRECGYEVLRGRG
jgi:ribose 5-phosphate isomerase A